ncbi:hypothetical protein Pla123a_12560 [Posidoniimonas polymericola]|uniref:Glycoamylase-like domain-containing protein n=1 Tax=Posidoniimonas polymericola TaxID=2528002 RepID=A0A5C5YTX4_9BACT|nr:glucoamylase family protein [Posidoniimonas polymericola]TWT78464.1 hypothetical protein Pla123a_12560 [Posidoniimonas polymericola]
MTWPSSLPRRRRYQRPGLATTLTVLAVAALGLLPQRSAVAQAPAVDVLRSATTEAARRYEFSADDHRLLERVQRGCFNLLWNEVGEPAKLARDFTGSDKASLAGIGFQLSALPIGVNRGWITRAQGEQRALTVLRSLANRDDNRRQGVFLHFVNPDSGGPAIGRHRPETSTIDHSLFLAGAAPAAVFFGGEVADIVARLADETNWRAYLIEDGRRLSMAFKPDPPYDVNGPGQLMTHHWWNASDEERLAYVLAVGGSNQLYRLPPESYYQLNRETRSYGDGDPFVVSWSGSLFTYFFTHCWIDYGAYDADNPAEFGFDKPRVDWLENSRRAALAHRDHCVAYADQYGTFSNERWGQSPCYAYKADGGRTYIVPSQRPCLSDEERMFDGTIAPYAAGSAIVLTPQESVAALRAFVELGVGRPELGLWDDPEQGGIGLADSFNLDYGKAFEGGVAIDAGPMLLAIENARSGLIWDLFRRHPMGERAAAALQWKPVPRVALGRERASQSR